MEVGISQLVNTSYGTNAGLERKPCTTATPTLPSGRNGKPGPRNAEREGYSMKRKRTEQNNLRRVTGNRKQENERHNKSQNF
jgi:hypothetical protein